MALAVYLMQAHDGRHREGFLDYVRDAYTGAGSEATSGRTLEDRVGVPIATSTASSSNTSPTGPAAP